MPRFADVLDKTIESIERPPLGPKGMYVFRCRGTPKKNDRKEYEVLDINAVAVRPADDSVPLDALQAYGDPQNILVKRSFFFATDDDAKFAAAEFQLRQFLEKTLGIDPSLSLKEALAAVPGREFIGELDYRPDDSNPDVLYHELKKSAPLE